MEGEPPPPGYRAVGAEGAECAWIPASRPGVPSQTSVDLKRLPGTSSQAFASFVLPHLLRRT